MLDFGALPPEINSARMYAGPGPASMLAAATAWQELGSDLNFAAASYGSIVSGLSSGAWLGPASVSMAAAVTPYVAWLGATAAQAEHAASQAAAAVAGYEAAFAATVPPPLIAANRSMLATLVTTNILGQNTAAIAAAEAHYGEMWAQDAAAMYGYATASSAATTVTPFGAPPQTTDQAGSAAQAAAVAAGETQPEAVIAATPPALQGLASPLGLGGAESALSTGASADSSALSLSSLSSLAMPARMAMMPMSMLMRMLMTGGTNSASKAGTGVAATAGSAAAGSVLGAGLASGTGTLGALNLTGVSGGAAAAGAAMGQSSSIGMLSVPPVWTATGPPTGSAAAVLSAAQTAGNPVAGLGQPGMPPMMPFTNMAGRGAVGGSAAQYDFRPSVIARSPIGG